MNANCARKKVKISIEPFPIETTMNVYGRSLMSDASRLANSTMVHKVLPYCPKKQKADPSPGLPLLNAPSPSLGGGQQSRAGVSMNVRCGRFEGFEHRRWVTGRQC